MTRVAMVATSLLVSMQLMGCTVYSLVPAAKPRAIGGRYQVDPQIEWSRRKVGTAELWTVHGPGLEAVYLTHGVSDGDTLFERVLGSQKKPPVFRPDMSPSEIAEFVVDSLAHLRYEQVELLDLRPEIFGGRAGFRFELGMLSDAGLELRGLATGRVDEKRLWLILFFAPRMHYYDAYLPHVERIIASVEFH